MRKLIMALIGVAGVLALGFSGYSFWLDGQSKQSLREAAKAISVRMDKASTDAVGETNITFGEFSDLAEETIKAIDSSVFAVKTAEARHKSPLTKDVENYAAAAQRLLRTLQVFMRETASYRTQEANALDALEELKKIGSVDDENRWGRLMKSAVDSTDKMEERAAKISEAAKQALADIEGLRSAAAAAGESLGRDIGVSEDGLNKLSERMKIEIDGGKEVSGS